MSGHVNKGVLKQNGGQIREVSPVLHPSLEAFAQTVAGILVDRHLERKRLRTKDRGETSVKTPRDSCRRGTDETRRNPQRR